MASRHAHSGPPNTRTLHQCIGRKRRRAAQPSVRTECKAHFRQSTELFCSRLPPREYTCKWNVGSPCATLLRRNKRNLSFVILPQHIVSPVDSLLAQLASPLRSPLGINLRSPVDFFSYTARLHLFARLLLSISALMLMLSKFAPLLCSLLHPVFGILARFFYSVPPRNQHPRNSLP